MDEAIGVTVDPSHPIGQENTCASKAEASCLLRHGKRVILRRVIRKPPFSSRLLQRYSTSLSRPETGSVAQLLAERAQQVRRIQQNRRREVEPSKTIKLPDGTALTVTDAISNPLLPPSAEHAGRLFEATEVKEPPIHQTTIVTSHHLHAPPPVRAWSGGYAYSNQERSVHFLPGPIPSKRVYLEALHRADLEFPERLERVIRARISDVN
ncbi:hypothetical protein GMRT_15648 [Giardia muris]|uniref:Uncharacterized protein n=1 Tax=Giardia muris TaxID=5742 RepID=A0A4Z1T8C4_GIAMU|nr:hypothetical protein GMRT_15648 [Giardia muris]|eukprot:TNJ28761.1 hypothetical protein GMRT_15648 [Giardia muris]